MASESGTPVFGTGGRGGDFPELPRETREAILARFNDGNPSFPGFLGYRAVEVRQGYARFEVDNREQLSNIAGIMHGGASFGLADTAVAAALVAIYGSGSSLLTVEMKINYLEPILPGLVTAEAYVLRSSRRSAYAEVDIWAGGKLAARATTTYMIKPLAESATGR
jgi:uncharacterized protein (TIGR00369 family)